MRCGSFRDAFMRDAVAQLTERGSHWRRCRSGSASANTGDTDLRSRPFGHEAGSGASRRRAWWGK